MGRQRLMAQQRKRLEDWRKKKKAAKTPAPKKSVTRDTSKDQSRKTIARLTGGSTPATGDAATKRLNNFLNAKPSVKNQPAKPAEVKPSTPAKPQAKPEKPKVKPSPQANSGSGRDGTFGSGTYGSGRPSDPKPKKKKEENKGRGGSRARVSQKRKDRIKTLREEARRVSEKARELNPNPSSMPMYPAKNPYKGHRYKKPFGPVMVYNGTKYVRETR